MITNLLRLRPLVDLPALTATFAEVHAARVAYMSVPQPVEEAS